jgi:methionyl-tRNA formyltransferase
MRISESFDTGPILSQTELTIDRTETTHTLALKAFPAGTSLFNDLLQRYPDGKFPEKPQAEEQSSYTHTVDKADSYIDFSREESELIDCKIRAYYPKPLAWGYLDQIVEFFNPHVTTPQKWSTKRVLLHNSSIESSSLIIDRLQIEGKEPINWKQFEMGYLQV